MWQVTVTHMKRTASHNETPESYQLKCPSKYMFYVLYEVRFTNHTRSLKRRQTDFCATCGIDGFKCISMMSRIRGVSRTPATKVCIAMCVSQVLCLIEYFTLGQ